MHNYYTNFPTLPHFFLPDQKMEKSWFSNPVLFTKALQHILTSNTFSKLHTYSELSMHSNPLMSWDRFKYVLKCSAELGNKNFCFPIYSRNWWIQIIDTSKEQSSIYLCKHFPFKKKYNIKEIWNLVICVSLVN